MRLSLLKNETRLIVDFNEVITENFSLQIVAAVPNNQQYGLERLEKNRCFYILFLPVEKFASQKFNLEVNIKPNAAGASL